MSSPKDAGAAGGGLAAPPLRLVLRGKDAVFVQRFEAGAPVAFPGAPVTPAPRDVPVKVAYDASSGVSPISLDGQLIAATDKDGVDIVDVSAPDAPRLRCRVAQAGIVCASFSPLSTLLLTWHRKRVDERAWGGVVYGAARL